MKFEVYKISNNTNNKIYIGITTRGYQKRFKKHIKEMEAGSAFILHNAMRSYGVENFSVTLLEECQDTEHLKHREQFWIKMLNTTDRAWGYNMTQGGDGTFGRLHSDETKAKMSKIAKGRVSRKRVNVTVRNVDTNEEVVYLSLTEASRGLGKSNSYMTELRTRYKADSFVHDNLEITFSKEEFEKPVKEKRDTAEHMKMMQDKSKEARQQNAEEYSKIQKEAKRSKTKIVQQYSLEGELLAEYNGAREAASILGVSRSPIQNALMGRVSKAYNSKWQHKQ